MKKSILIFFTAAFAFSLFSCNSKKVSSEKKSYSEELTLTMAEVNPPGTISSEMDRAFKEKVEELSGGKIKIDLQFNGILGDENSIIKMMSSPNSSIQLSRISAFNLTALGCQKSALFTIPFTFKNRDHFWNFAESDTAQAILNEPYEKSVGIKGVFYGEEGFRHFFSTKPLSSTSDFERMNVRVSSDPVMHGIVRGLKAIPVSVAFADLYSALQTGKTEAAEQPIANYLANHFHNIAPYMILDGHTLGVTEVVITSDCWDSLSPYQKDIISKAGKYAGEVCRKISQEAEDKAVTELKAQGAVFTEVNDITPWKNTCVDITREITQTDPELYQQILDLAN